MDTGSLGRTDWEYKGLCSASMLSVYNFATRLVAGGLGAYGPKLERMPKGVALVEVSYRPQSKSPLNKRKKPHDIGLGSHEKFQLPNACGKGNPGDLWSMSGKAYAADARQAARSGALLDLLLITKELAGDVRQ